MEIFENLDLQDLDGEIWKDIEGYNGDYQVSNLGRIKSFKKYRGTDVQILKQIKNGGYLIVSLSKNGKEKTEKVHRLEFKTFYNYKLKENECKEFSSFIIHHIDENKLNNILDNFKFMVNFDHNSLHKSGEKHSMYGKYHSEESKQLMRNKKLGKKCPYTSKRMSGENNPQVKLKEQDVIKIRKLLDEGILTQKEIAEMFGVKQSTISMIKNKKNWKNISN